MIAAPTPDPAREPASRTFDVLRAMGAGFVAWLPIALAGQLLAWTAFAVTGAFRPWSWVKIGLLNAIAVSRVGFDVRTAPPSGLRRLLPELFGAPSVRVTFALGAGTLVAIVLLFRAGRDAVRRAAHERPVRRRAAPLLGAAVGAGFAVASGVAALLVTLRFPQADVTSLRPVVWQAFVFPLAVGATAGVIGGAAAGLPPVADRGRAERRIVAASRGAWHALVWGVVLALFGTLVLATLRPSASAAYGRWLEDRGSAGAVLAMYHALLLPNQSVDVLAVAMGSCAELGTGDTPSSLCLGGLDAGEGPARLLTGGRTRSGFGPGFLAFWLVPALATIAGGRRAAAGARRASERALRALGAGVGFGVLVGVSAWAATITIDAGGERIAWLGADPLGSAALGIAWGVVGASIGARLPDPAGTPVEPALRRQEPEGLPSETSLK